MPLHSEPHPTDSGASPLSLSKRGPGSSRHPIPHREVSVRSHDTRDGTHEQGGQHATRSAGTGVHRRPRRRGRQGFQRNVGRGSAPSHVAVVRHRRPGTGRLNRGPQHSDDGRRPAAAHLHPRGRRPPSGAGLLPRRWLGRRQSGQPRRDLPSPDERCRLPHHLGRLPPRARTQIPGRGRRLLRSHQVGGPERGRGRRRPAARRGWRRQRRR